MPFFIRLGKQQINVWRKRKKTRDGGRALELYCMLNEIRLAFKIFMLEEKGEGGGSQGGCCFSYECMMSGCDSTAFPTTG